MTLGTFSERLGTFEQSAESSRCKSVVCDRPGRVIAGGLSGRGLDSVSFMRAGA